MSEPDYPLTVRLTGGRIRHQARQVSTGIVATLCGRRGNPADDGKDRPLCAACAVLAAYGPDNARALAEDTRIRGTYLPIRGEQR